MKWEACDGVNENESCKGSMKFGDVNATMLDDLDCEFTCKAGGTLATAMRKQGVTTVKKCIESCMLRLQEEVRAEKSRADAEKVPETRRANVTPAVNIPLPKPIAVTTVPTKPTTGAVPSKSISSGDSSEEEAPAGDSDTLPPVLEAALRKLRDEPENQKEVSLANCSLRDAHLQVRTQRTKFVWSQCCHARPIICFSWSERHCPLAPPICSHYCDPTYAASHRGSLSLEVCCRGARPCIQPAYGCGSARFVQGALRKLRARARETLSGWE